MVRKLRFGLAVVGLMMAIGVASAKPEKEVSSPGTEQFVGVPSYRVGPYAAGGTGVFGGMIDYFQHVNQAGGVNGVRLVWEECETEYNISRGLACYDRLKKKGKLSNSAFVPLSTGISYAVIDRVPGDKVPLITLGLGRTDSTVGSVFPWVFPLVSNYLSGNSIKIRYMASKEGGLDRLAGKTIVNLYHDSAYGKETLEVLDVQAKRYGFRLVNIAVPHPGNDQQAQWRRIKDEKADWVILRGWGIMNPMALKTAERYGFPAERIVGSWWAGSEEDVAPARDAAKGFVATSFTGVGDDYPVIRNIRQAVYGQGRGNMEDEKRVGSVYYNRGVVHGILVVEAVRTAQAKFGSGIAMTPEQMRWGFENLKLDTARLRALGADGLMPPIAVSCDDHEGSGRAQMIQWDGKGWRPVGGGWVEPDRSIVRPLIEGSALRYAREKSVAVRHCGAEGV